MSCDVETICAGSKNWLVRLPFIKNEDLSSAEFSWTRSRPQKETFLNSEIFFFRFTKPDLCFIVSNYLYLLVGDCKKNQSKVFFWISNLNIISNEHFGYFYKGIFKYFVKKTIRRFHFLIGRNIFKVSFQYFK